MSQRTAALLVVLATAIVGVGLALEDTESGAGGSWLLPALLYLTAGFSFVVAGIAAAARRPENRTGFLLIGTGFTWFLGFFGTSSNDVVFTGAALVSSLPYALLVALVLGYPTGTLPLRVDRALVGIVVALVTVGQLAFLLVATSENLCGEARMCPENLLRVTDSTTANVVDRWILNGLIVLTVIAIVWRLTHRYSVASPALRRVIGPVYLAAGATFLAAGVALVTADLAAGVSELAWLVQVIALLGIPAAFLLGLVRSRLARGAIADLIVSFGTGASLRDAIAGALGDPALTIAYPLDDGRWIDDEGRAVEPVGGPGTGATPALHDGVVIATLIHDASLADEPELIEGVAGAAALALRTQGLQAEARAQYDFLETLVNNAPSLFVHIGTDARIRNQNVAAITAAAVDDEEEIRGRCFWDVFVDPAERETAIARFEAAAPTFPADEHENSFVNARGERHVIFWRTAPVTDEAGLVNGIIAGGIDITLRKHRELELERERDATTTVLEAIPSVIAVLDRAGTVRDRDVDNPLAAVNRAFRELLDWGDDELVGRSFLELVAEDVDGRARDALVQAASGDSSLEIESPWLRADGGLVNVAWTATPVSDVTGRRDGLILVSGVDITDRLAQDEEIRASRARIVSAADEARRRLERNLHDGAQQRLVALSVALRLAESRLAAGRDDAPALIAAAREELSLALEELRELARGIHPAVLTDRGLGPALESLVARSPLPVELRLPARELPPRVEAAAYYVVSEALTNVVKYAGATEAAVEITERNGTVMVSVRDDGVGGADPMLGSGLRGLVDRVEALDGLLVVDSAPGTGTTVRAEIPSP